MRIEPLAGILLNWNENPWQTGGGNIDRVRAANLVWHLDKVEEKEKTTTAGGAQGQGKMPPFKVAEDTRRYCCRAPVSRKEKTGNEAGKQECDSALWKDWLHMGGNLTLASHPSANARDLSVGCSGWKLKAFTLMTIFFCAVTIKGIC